MPASLKRKRPAGTVAKVNAAPEAEGGEGGEAESSGSASAAPRADLMDALKNAGVHVGPKTTEGAPVEKKRKVETVKKEGQGDDYKAFLEEVGDLL